MTLALLLVDIGDALCCLFADSHRKCKRPGSYSLASGEFRRLLII